MAPAISLSHVALLVPSLERSLAVLPQDLYRVGPIETFCEAVDGETREVYLGPESYARGMLLFVQSTTSRWFSRFAERFGYGLHHVAIDVPSVVEYCELMNEKGWFLHIGSAFSLVNLKSVYLVRPGFPLIIEVQTARSEEPNQDHFISQVTVTVNCAADADAIANLQIPGLIPQMNGDSSILIDDHRWNVATLVDKMSCGD